MRNKLRPASGRLASNSSGPPRCLSAQPRDAATRRKLLKLSSANHAHETSTATTAHDASMPSIVHDSSMAGAVHNGSMASSAHD
eukprot:1766703-Prymnesium_polylepis.1